MITNQYFDLYTLYAPLARGGAIPLQGPYPAAVVARTLLVVFWQITISKIRFLLNKFVLQIIMLLRKHCINLLKLLPITIVFN